MKRLIILFLVAFLLLGLASNMIAAPKDTIVVGLYWIQPIIETGLRKPL